MHDMSSFSISPPPNPSPRSGATMRRALTLCWLALATLGVPPALAQTPPSVTVDPARSVPERGRALVSLSGDLVKTAQSAKGHASAFRIDVTHYRESLRDLVKDNDKLPERERLPKSLVLDMVRMVGLLQSAAQCQTGRYIVCPPDLMDQLLRQQAAMERGLAAASTVTR